VVGAAGPLGAAERPTLGAPDRLRDNRVCEAFKANMVKTLLVPGGPTATARAASQGQGAGDLAAYAAAPAASRRGGPDAYERSTPESCSETAVTAPILPSRTWGRRLTKRGTDDIWPEDALVR
jgi:hypothetical protein